MARSRRPLQFSFGLFTFTLWRSTVQQGRLTDKSVRIAERALTELEAPFVFVDVVDTGLEVTDGMARLAQTQFRFRVTNYGRTPALLTALQTVYRILDAEVIPAPIDAPHHGGRQLPAGVVSTFSHPYEEMENFSP